MKISQKEERRQIWGSRNIPVAREGFAAEQKTAYDFLQQEKAYPEGYYALVVAPAETSAKISLFDQELFQFFHEAVPEIFLKN